MAGLTDYSAQASLAYWTGGLIVPALPTGMWLGLFTTAPTSDAGVTGATEVSGGAYARVQVSGSLTTNAVSTASATLNFAATVPAWIVAGMYVRSVTTPGNIGAGITVVSTTATTVVISSTVTVANGEVIKFSAFAPATASSGSEPSTLPASISNTNTVITFPQATASWGTVQAWGLFDAVTTGNLVWWDYLGNFKWLPFSGSAASPSVITSPAHGYSLADAAVVTAKFGGTLPTLSGGSFSPTLLVAATVATDTFTLTTSGATALNASATGNGSIRKIVLQPIAINVTASFAAAQMTLTMA